MSVNTYKGLALNLYVLGLHPVDLAGVCILALIGFMFTRSPLASLFAGVSGYFVLKRFKNIGMETRKIFIRFLITPGRFAVKNEDIPFYTSCLK